MVHGSVQPGLGEGSGAWQKFAQTQDLGQTPVEKDQGLSFPSTLLPRIQQRGVSRQMLSYYMSEGEGAKQKCVLFTM